MFLPAIETARIRKNHTASCKTITITQQQTTLHAIIKLSSNYFRFASTMKQVKTYLVLSFSTIRKKTLKPVASGARCGEGKIFKSLEEKKKHLFLHTNKTRQDS